MEKLKNLSRYDLEEEYYWTFGQDAETIPTDKIIASLYYGKRAQYLTLEELHEIEE